ncbi:MAG: hypothetical protein ACE5RT_01300 [Nitrosopumilaceae archaeon]
MVFDFSSITIPEITIPEIVSGKPIVIFSIPGDVDINVAPETRIAIPANRMIISSFIEI